MTHWMTVRLPIKADESGCLIVPDGAEIKGVLDLSETTDITSLPDGIKAGAVDLFGSRITKLPSRMEVSSWIDIQKTDIRISDLPNDLRLGTRLIFDDENGLPATCRASDLRRSHP